MGGTSSKQKSSTQESSPEKLNKQWFDAIASNDINKVKALLPSILNVNLTDTTGKTALYYVRDKQIAEFLMAEGADVNATDKYKFTPLHYAQNREIAQILIGQGADLQALSCNAFGKQHTPLTSALTYAKADVALCLIDNFSLEQLKEKPGFLDNTANKIYSEHWEAIKQKKEADSTSTTQNQDTGVATAYQSRLLGASHLFAPSTDTEEEVPAKTEKRKVMLKH